MNKLIITLLFTILSVVGLAQESFNSYERIDLNTNVNEPRAVQLQSTVDNVNVSVGDYETLADGTGGQPTVPIDNYQFLLLGLAVLLIAYFVYRSRQAQQA